MTIEDEQLTRANFFSTFRPANFILSKFINSLQHLTTNEHSGSLLVNILKTCPDLLKSFFKSTTLEFDPALEEKFVD